MVHIDMGKQKGFTIIELMVVIAIIAILLGIILASVSQARAATRDKKRAADLAAIEYSLTIYTQKQETYPSYPSGTEIGIGNPIDAVLSQYGIAPNADPLSGGGSGDAHAYWYDSDFDCTKAGQSVLFAKNMEVSKNANFSSVCTDSSADTAVAGSDSYIIILKQH